MLTLSTIDVIEYWTKTVLSLLHFWIRFTTFSIPFSWWKGTTMPSMYISGRKSIKSNIPIMVLLYFQFQFMTSLCFFSSLPCDCENLLDYWWFIVLIVNDGHRCAINVFDDFNLPQSWPNLWRPNLLNVVNVWTILWACPWKGGDRVF